MNKVTEELDYKGKDNTIGERIGYIRRLRKIKQEDLAEKLHIKRNALSNYEQDKRNPPLDIIVNISKILEIPTDYLLGINEIEDYDMEEQNIGNTIGLSSKSIKVLQEMKKYNSTALRTIDFLIRQEEMFPAVSIGFEASADISQEELEKLEVQAFEKVEQEENKWNSKHFTIISAIDKFLNVQIPNEELYVTKNSIKKEEDFNTQFQKILHTKKKIDIKKIVDTALINDINTELRKAKKYIEGRNQNKK